jgi:hypothetical protein
MTSIFMTKHIKH